MSGYIALARIVRAGPRLVRAGTIRDGLLERSPARAVETQIVESEASVAADASGLVEKVAAVRERWSQLTFFLFDPNSWR